jgi:hypothetical protein
MATLPKAFRCLCNYHTLCANIYTLASRILIYSTPLKPDSLPSLRPTKTLATQSDNPYPAAPSSPYMDSTSHAHAQSVRSPASISGALYLRFSRQAPKKPPSRPPSPRLGHRCAFSPNSTRPSILTSQHSRSLAPHPLQPGPSVEPYPIRAAFSDEEVQTDAPPPQPHNQTSLMQCVISSNLLLASPSPSPLSTPDAYSQTPSPQNSTQNLLPLNATTVRHPAHNHPLRLLFTLAVSPTSVYPNPPPESAWWT